MQSLKRMCLGLHQFFQEESPWYCLDRQMKCREMPIMHTHKGMTEDELVGWHHRLNGHEFEQTLKDGEGQGGLGCCSPWGCKGLDGTERPNNNKTHIQHRCI